MTAFPVVIDMTRRALLSLALALVAIVIGAWLLSRQVMPEKSPPSPQQGSSAEPPASTSEVHLGAEEAVVPPGFDVAKAHQPTRTVPGERRRIGGKILIPPGAPSEDSLSIMADGWPPLDLDQRVGPFPVASDGAYELQIPMDWSTVALELKSRWLYFDEPQVAFQSNRPPAELRTALGARLECSITLPGSGGADMRGYSGALVEVCGDDSGREPATISSHDVQRDLEWTFDALPAGRVGSLYVWSPRLQSILMPLHLVAGEQTKLVLPLERGVTVRGDVVGRDGRPVVEASIRSMAAKRSRSEATSLTAGGKPGAFEISGLPPIEQELLFVAPNCCARLVPIPALAPGETLEGVHVVLAPFATLEGTVVDEEGKPCPGTPLILEDLDRSHAPVFDLDSDSSQELHEGHRRYFRGSERWHNTLTGLQTDRAGKFRCDKLAGGRIQLTALVHGKLGRASVELVEGEAARVSIEVRAHPYLFIYVEGDRFPEVPDAEIHVVDDWGVDFAVRSLRVHNWGDVQRQTGIKGFPVGPLFPGSYHVSATSKDGRHAEQTVSFEGRESEQVKLEL